MIAVVATRRRMVSARLSIMIAVAVATDRYLIFDW